MTKGKPVTIHDPDKVIYAQIVNSNGDVLAEISEPTVCATLRMTRLSEALLPDTEPDGEGEFCVHRWKLTRKCERVDEKGRLIGCAYDKECEKCGVMRAWKL